MSWRIDFALLLQSVLSLSLDQVKEVLAQNPNDIQQALSTLPDEKRVESLNICGSTEHQNLKEKILRQNLNLVFYSESGYPQILLDWPKAPQVLWYLGQACWQTRQAFAVVGSRNPSSATQNWLNWQMSDFLKQHKPLVVSGGAVGVDQLAHWLAVRQNTPTVALMPTGLLNRYPPSFYQVEAAILGQGGALMSPFVPNWPIYKFNFVRRNQVIAAMSLVTFIAEARRRSGTLLTAKAAIDLGRPVGVLPCSPMSHQGLGALDLIVEGSGQLIRDKEDLQTLWDRHRPRQLVLEDTF